MLLEQQTTAHRAVRFVIIIAVLLGAAFQLPPRFDALAANTPSSGPDLTAEIVVLAAVPQAGQPSTIRVTVRNQGAGSANTGFFVYLYVNPNERPPGPSTRDTYFWFLPGLPAGASSSLERSFTFPTTGCDHIIYVWVDRENQVIEDNKANNLVSEAVCVGVTCQMDSYETDDLCAGARWLSTGDAAQSRTLCPLGDEDWVKFTATAGRHYTMAATNLGAHADPVLGLFNHCESLAQYDTGATIHWTAPGSGVYYLRVRHRQEDHGPLTNYDLSISASGGASDPYEPDDTCATAREMPLDGTKTRRLFQSPGDQDWVKFSVPAGASFSLIADNTGPGVQPQIALFNSCTEVDPATAVAPGQVQHNAGLAQTYYARVTNQNPNIYGAEARYDLTLQILPCAADAFEEDDSPAQASAIPVTGTTQTRNVCPAADQDWVRFTATAGATYSIQTSSLGAAADTQLHLYGADGVTELARNDDYGYTLASRILWQAPQDGDYYVKVQHHNPGAAGADTRYDLAIAPAACTPDAYEPDNGALDAPVQVTDGRPQRHNFCPGQGAAVGAQALHFVRGQGLRPAQGADTGDQDWVRFEAVAGSAYRIWTTNLGENSDTVLELYDRSGLRLLASNDDRGPGRASDILFQAAAAGFYYVRVRPFNPSLTGAGAEYDLAIQGAAAPTATPTPSPTPTPTPTPRPTMEAGKIKTVILVNHSRLAELHAAAEADAVLDKAYALADHARVQGAVVKLEDDPAVAAAYAAWTADADTLLDNVQANAVAGAIRNLVLSFAAQSPDLEYIVIVGDDRAVPHRRAPQGTISKLEHEYAPSATANTTLWASLQQNMILTDDFYADREPTLWQGRELYLPDYAVGRLIEEPAEIIAQIDAFLERSSTPIQRALVTGYDFVVDTGTAVTSLLRNDGINTDDTLVGPVWPGDELRARQLQTRFDLQSINGHAQHDASGTPDKADIQALEIMMAATDLRGTVIFSVGCHSGFNDSGSLDLAQAFASRQALYVGNTGYGWGGGGVVYSELLMRNFARELLRDTSARVGTSLAAAKRRYYQYQAAMLFTPYDEMVLMQAVLYGLPMYEVTTGEALSDDDPFPSVDLTTLPPTAFGEVGVGTVSLGLPGSFGAFDENETEHGVMLALNDHIDFAGGDPVQPRFFAAVPSTVVGSLHGVLFLGGVYTDVVGFDPVIALPYNEYIESTDETAFSSEGWHPSVPFRMRGGASSSTADASLLAVLGQFDSNTDTQRIYDHMSFSTFFSDSPDTSPPTITHRDGVLEGGHESTIHAPTAALIKVEAHDPSGVLRVVVAYTSDQGVWQSQELSHDAAAGKWIGSIPVVAARAGNTGAFSSHTYYFLQVVDGAGNVAVDDNKGRYYRFQPSMPLAAGRNYRPVFLPDILRGG